MSHDRSADGDPSPGRAGGLLPAWTRTCPSRRLAPWLVGTAIAVAVTLAAAAPAAAHAELESTQPVQASVVSSAPRQIVLRFDEPVEIDFGSLMLIAPGGGRVDEGGTYHPGGDDRAVAIPVPSKLARGTYIVAWRVVSADSHPVHGAFDFSIGAASAGARSTALLRALTNQSGSAAVGAIYWLIRFAGFASLLLLVGLAWMVLITGAAEGAAKRIRWVLWSSWGALLALSVAAIAVQGVYAAELPITDVYRPSLFDAVLHTRFGVITAIRVLLLLLVSVPLLVHLDRRLAAPGAAARPAARPGWIGAGIVLGLALLATPGLAGHASTGSAPALGMAVDLVHLAAVSTWIGGLSLLGATLIGAAIPEPAMLEPAMLGPTAPVDPQGRHASGVELEPPGGTASLARTVSAYAFYAALLVVVTGVIQSLRQVGSLYALFNTVYGRTLIVKVALVAVLLVVGAWSRRSVARHGLGQLRRSVSLEIGITVAILAVTALLVNDVPARQAATAPIAQSYNVLGVQINMVVSPARAGPGNQFHFYVLGSNGQLESIPELEASISLPSHGAGALSLPLLVAAPGHYRASAVDIPYGGTWVLRLNVRTAGGAHQEVFGTLPLH